MDTRPTSSLHKEQANNMLQGYCTSCRQYHFLHTDNSGSICASLMKWLQKEKRIDYLSSFPSDPDLSTENLFGESRGKMFGVLEGRNKKGQNVCLYAFSGQYNGRWNVPGWAPPLFEEDTWFSVNNSAEQEIKRIGSVLNTYETSSPEHTALKRLRKQMSRQLMRQLHALYTVRNFKGQSSALMPFFPAHRGIPTGTGDCCAPKLLNYALLKDIRPVAIAEFYWGRTNKSKSRLHGHFYPACHDKCMPILGFMLCGLEKNTNIINSTKANQSMHARNHAFTSTHKDRK